MLVIRLQNPDDAEPAWALLTGAVADWQHGSWDTLLPSAQGQTVVLLIPAREVLLTQTTINTRNKRQLQQAVPYALEEALADDAENQHIVWQARSDSPQLDAAVVLRERLLLWQSVLIQRGLRPSTILPDVFALPWEAELLTLWQQGDHVWVRTSELAGFSCNRSALPLVLDNLRATYPAPMRIRWHSDQPDTWQADEAFTLIPEIHTEQLHASSLNSALPLNLLRGLQSEHTATRREQWRRWRLAAVLTGVAVILGFSTYGLHIYRMQQELAALDAQNLSLFSELFPQASNVDARALPLRFDSAVQDLKNKGGVQTQRSPLELLATFAQAFAGNTGLSVESIQTQAGSVSVSLQAKEQQAVDNLRAALGEGATLKSSHSDNTIKASLTLGDKP
ncbi:type II secretion system protein GspL [Candidatus Thiothrix anitrata]|uniref:Type II secretion system protein L n=1 Tax=Candidatus Thiothrix anitrata TaxID=2823902 RepID=A0ABX7X3E7_9GAMM|nr:type II secretion system protein GspL [Candidatus Thiothrix anitrata]QTR50426.1 hypothetical protein J8380_02250 [Candidatus Thiothrix anitrata]